MHIGKLCFYGFYILTHEHFKWGGGENAKTFYIGYLEGKDGSIQ